MKRLWLVAALAVTLWFGAAPRAWSQSLEQNVTYCDNSAGQFTADLVVSGCTALIQSGQFGDDILGIAYFNRGNAYYDLGNFSAAVADYNQVIRLQPREGNAFGNRATAYRAMGDLARALADYNSALALRPHPLDFKNRGDVYAGLGDHTRAAADYGQALAFNPQDAAALLGRANSYAELGDSARSEADYRQAAALIPDGDAAANNDLCWMLAVAGRALDVARSACDRAIALAANAQDRAHYYDSRGLVGLKQGRHQQAWNDYDTALRDLPDQPHFLYGRGIAAARLGRAAEGRVDIARAAQLNAGIAQAYSGYGIEAPSGGFAARPTPPARVTAQAPELAPSPGQTIAGMPPPGRRAYAFYCPNNQVLRVIFDSEDGTAVVTRIRQPNTTLRRAPSDVGFRYSDTSYELSGTLESVQWRVGSGRPMTCPNNRGE